MKNKNIYFVFAPIRSGHHAIMEWLMANMNGKSVFFNNCHLNTHNNTFSPNVASFFEFWQNGENLHRVGIFDFDFFINHNLDNDEIENFVFSFEMAEQELILERKYLFEKHIKDIPNSNKKIIFVNRDPYNCLSSTLKSNFEFRVAWARDIVLSHLAIAEEKPSSLYGEEFFDINYNKWFKSKEYRSDVLLEILGRTEEENTKTMGHVCGYGYGSTWQGRKVNPKDLNVFKRWEFFKNHDLYKTLFSWGEEDSRRVKDFFGLSHHFDEDGALVVEGFEEKDENKNKNQMVENPVYDWSKEYPEGYSLCCVVVNKYKKFKTCLESWMRIRFPLPFEVNITLNGNENEKLVQYVKDMQEKYSNINVFYLSWNSGAAQALNNSFLASRYRYIIKLDDDALFPSCTQWPERFRNYHLNNPKAGAIGGVALSTQPMSPFIVRHCPSLKNISIIDRCELHGKMYNHPFLGTYNQKLSKTVEEDGKFFLEKDMGFRKRSDFLQGCFVFYHRDIFERIGYYPEFYGKHGNDDIAFDARLRGSGFFNAVDTATYYVHWKTDGYVEEDDDD